MAKLTSQDLEALSSFWQPQNLAAKPPDPRNLESFHWFGQNNAGVSVTPDTALQVSTIWACVNVISNSIASSDWNVYEKLKQNDRELLYDDSTQYLLNTRPNREMTAKSWKTALMIAACFWGNGYAEIVLDRAGRLAGLWPIAPDRVQPYRDDDGLFYRVENDDGGHVFLRDNEMMHIRGPGISGILGDNVITRASHAIALAIAAERFAEAYFGNGTQMGMMLETPDAASMSQESYDRLKEDFTKKHAGPTKAFRFGVIGAGSKIHMMNVEADKAQLTDSRLHQVEEICRWFGVPPHMVAHLRNATLNNVEHLGIQFSRNTLRPWAREIQEECDYKLFPRRSKPRFILLDLEWASQGDYKSRMEGHQIGRGMGVLSANDILLKENQNTIGPEGDIRIVNGAAVRLEDVGKNMVAPATTSSSQPDRGEGSQPKERAYKRHWITASIARVLRFYQSRVQQNSGDVAKARQEAVEYCTREFSLIFDVLSLDKLVHVETVLTVLTNENPAETYSIFIESIGE